MKISAWLFVFAVCAGQSAADTLATFFRQKLDNVLREASGDWPENFTAKAVAVTLGKDGHGWMSFREGQLHNLSTWTRSGDVTMKCKQDVAALMSTVAFQPLWVSLDYWYDNGTELFSPDVLWAAVSGVSAQLQVDVGLAKDTPSTATFQLQSAGAEVTLHENTTFQSDSVKQEEVVAAVMRHLEGGSESALATVQKNIQDVLAGTLAKISWDEIPKICAAATTLAPTTTTNTAPPASTAPTEKPTDTPTEKPTDTPTEKPTAAPTEKPTDAPTEKPTAAPTEKPTAAPTEKPTAAPTEKPTDTPTEKPTDTPTEKPTDAPTEKPTAAPTEKPTDTPTEKPTDTPTEKPTAAPTEKPTAAPTEKPTDTPTEKPTDAPTEKPTDAPTEKPTAAPTEKSTAATTEKPTAAKKNPQYSADESGRASSDEGRRENDIDVALTKDQAELVGKLIADLLSQSGESFPSKHLDPYQLADSEQELYQTQDGAATLNIDLFWLRNLTVAGDPEYQIVDNWTATVTADITFSDLQYSVQLLVDSTKSTWEVEGHADQLVGKLVVSVHVTNTTNSTASFKSFQLMPFVWLTGTPTQGQSATRAVDDPKEVLSGVKTAFKAAVIPALVGAASGPVKKAIDGKVWDLGPALATTPAPQVQTTPAAAALPGVPRAWVVALAALLAASRLL
ncbi:mucin-5AC-like [Bacillus rossius redtenbacheri]|uniref:mucin-5AC-like n=1 Tax=Bacillus rossius redtenbacheri TaxID=93214 RepID=UPI002FDCA25C